MIYENIMSCHITRLFSKVIYQSGIKSKINPSTKSQSASNHLEQPYKMSEHEELSRLSSTLALKQLTCNPVQHRTSNRGVSKGGALDRGGTVALSEFE